MGTSKLFWTNGFVVLFSHMFLLMFLVVFPVSFFFFLVTFWGFENLDPRKYNEAMSKLQKLGLGRNEEHLNSKQKDFQRGKSKNVGDFFSLNFIFKLFIKLFNQILFCHACTCKVTYNIKMLKTHNPWIICQFLFTKII